MSADENEYNPAWLDAENDETHRDEIAPLFGTGSLALQDTEEDNQPHFSAAVNYGSTDTPDDNSASANTSLAAAASNASSSKTTKDNKIREIVVTESGKPEAPRRGIILHSFYFIEGFGVITSLCLMATQILPLFFLSMKQIGLAEMIQKVYVTLFCLLFLLVECDVPLAFLKNASFLQTYFSRGFLYSFLGLSCLEEAYSERVKDMVVHSKEQFHVSWISLFMQVSSWMMLALGILYMLLGMCCLKLLRDKVKDQDKEKWAIYRDAMKLYRQTNPK